MSRLRSAKVLMLVTLLACTSTTIPIKAPSRVVASIAIAPGHFEPMGIDTVEIPNAALAVPQLIIANSADDRSGTERPFRYFQKYFTRGAPWVFAIQNDVPHCCAVNAERLMLLWLDVIIEQRRPSANTPLKPMQRRHGWLAFIKTKGTETKAWTHPTSAVVDSIVQPENEPAPPGYLAAGWLPTSQIAREWIRFTKDTHHWMTPL
jgi:hypothetical protein